MSISIFIIILILFFLGYQNDFGRGNNIPIDHEQKGLKDQIVINFSHVVAENTPKGLTANKFAELVEKKTNGKVKVEVYPNGMLYSDDDEMRALQTGDIQMIAPSYSKITEMIPEWQVLDLPFLFHDYEDIKIAFTGTTSTDLLALLNKEHIKGLALWSNGFKQMTSNKAPLLAIDDFKDLKVRTMSSKMLKQQFELVGANPIELGFDQVFSVLEDHHIDAQENTISNIYSKGFYKYQKHMTISNHGVLGYAVMMNEDFWKSLPKDIQLSIQKAMEEATMWNLKQSEQMNKNDLEKIKKTSPIHMYELSEEQKQAWVNAWKPLYKNYKTTINNRFIQQIQEQISQ